MTQTPRTPVKWIVPVPDNDPFGRKTFATVCRGNADIGSVLNYFVYEASRKVEREETDISKIESVTLENRQQDVIAQRAGVSKKTLIAHIKKLVEWNLIVADAYRHHYEVYHKNIAKDILHPPEEIKPKLRGIHVANCKSTISTISTIPEGITLEAFQQMWQEIVDLRSESVKQRTTIVDLQNEIVRLHSVQSSEGTSQQGLNPVFDTPNSSNSNQEIEESSDVSFVASHPSSSEQPPSPSYSQDSYKTSNVAHVSQESEPTHADLPLSAHPGFAGSRSEPPAVPVDNITGNAITADWHPVSDGTPGRNLSETDMAGDILESHGYEKGGRDESSTDSIWDRDTGGSGRDSALLPAPKRPLTRGPQDQAARQTQTTQEVTQQTSLSQGLAPALDGDARERSAPPVATALLLSHTLQATSLLSEMSLDALLSQPRGERTEIKTLLSQVRGQMTRMTQGEPIRAGNTSSEATSQSTETAPMKPVSQNKTIQAKKNKKVPEGPPAFPAPDALWNAEVAVEIVEAKKGRRYGETTRAQELMEAKKVLKMDFNGEPLTRTQFEDAWDAMAGWAFWKEHTNVKPMIRTLRKDDKIIAILEELSQKKMKSNGGGNGSPPSSGGSTNGIRPTISGKRRLDIDDSPPLAAAHTSARSQIWA